MNPLKILSDDPVEQTILEADAQRMNQAGEAELAEADEQRILSVRRESELNRIAGDLPDDMAALWVFAEYNLTQSIVTMIHAGRAFIKLKEKLPHGEYEAGLKERGIPPQTAWQMSRVALRFADRSEKFLKLGRTKLYACLEFSNEELDVLEEGGSILDQDLDALDKMTTRELKALIKKKDADLDVKDQLLESKNKQIDDVVTENTKLRGGVVEGEISPVLQAIESDKLGAVGNVLKLAARAKNMEVDAMNGKEPNREEYFTLNAAFEELRSQLAQGMDALYNCGGSYQAMIAEAAVATDDIG